MMNWQVTAATIYCEAIDGEATVLVYKDGSVKCVSYQKYAEPDAEVVKSQLKKDRRFNRQLACQGPECHRLIQYRDRLFAEEAKGDRGER
jgi:(2Fe-2S) ferredoxin